MDADAILNRVRERYPEWSIYRSGIGRYWASTSDRPSLTQQQAGALAQVGADSLDELDDLLDKQQKIRRSYS
ncbi:hypothetical protein [Nonomuraea sp. NPDC050310]|uniref:hypothetical protein n=1 Tax=Nonomuraea sp. NPDC050310 TaxID=3154935 RepID=UPI0033F121D7